MPPAPLLTVRTERRGGSAATDSDVEVRRNLRTLAPWGPSFDVSLPPSSVGFAQNERNTWFRAWRCHHAADGMNVAFTRRDECSARTRPVTVRTERRGGSAATDADVEVRRNLRTLAPWGPYFDVSLPPSSVGFARNERNTCFRGIIVAALVAIAAATAACAPPTPTPPGALTLPDLYAANALAGEWTWGHDELEDGTARTEVERWRFTATADRRVLDGNYQRRVEIRALDGVPFVCAQRPRYALHAEHTVVAHIVGGGARIEERGYEVTPSPCDPGLRQLTSYDAEIHRDRLILRWDGGEATLHRAVPATAAPAIVVAPPPAAPAGRWTWQLASWTRAGLVQIEDEDWELAMSPGGELAGTYVRATTVRSPDGAPLPCAGAPSYRYVDRYLIRGRRDPEGDGWRLEEVGQAPGEHPCLAATPTRTRDDATAELEGEYLVLTWRGKRRQVLARP